MADKMIFQKSWYDAIMADEYLETTEQEMAYILYAAMIYSFDGTRINLGEVFGAEFKGLNRSMPNIYQQIDGIKNWGEKNQQKNQKYDNEAIKELAAMGYTQKQICIELGYDVAKAKSLSSNPGYKEGRAIWLAKLAKEKESSVTVSNKTSEKLSNSFDF
jgi:hypothetical protein